EDSGGAAVVEQGTILVVKKGGILGVPYSDQTTLPTKYENGTVHSPNALVSKGIGSLMGKLGKTQTTQFFQANTKYIHPRSPSICRKTRSSSASSTAIPVTMSIRRRSSRPTWYSS